MALDDDLLPNRAGQAEQKRRDLHRRVAALEASLREVLEFCDETLLTDTPDFHLAIERARKLLSENSGT